MIRVTIKGLFAHKLRFVLTALAVVLGVAFMSGTFVLTDTVQKVFDELFADVNKGTDAYVRNAEKQELPFGGTERPRIPESLLPVVGDVDGAQATAPGVSTYAQLVDKKGKVVGNPNQGAPTFGFNWVEVPELENFTIVDGGPPETADEMVIDKGSADKADYRVGDSARVVSTAKTKEYEIVGIAKFGDADSPAGASVMLFTLPEVQRMAKATGELDAITVVADQGVSQEDLKKRISDSPEVRSAAQTDRVELETLTGAQITKENQDDIKKDLQFFNTALLIFAGVALLVGAFIIVNTFTIVIAQRTKEWALLRALGASGRQVRVAVLSEALTVGLVASVVGVVIGIGLSMILKQLLNQFGFEIPGGSVVVNPDKVLIAIAVGTVVTLLSAILPARRAARISPMAAMREVSLETSRGFGRRVLIGLVLVFLGACAFGWGLAGDGGAPYVGLGAGVVFLAVAILGPVIARPVSDVLGWLPARVRGMTGQLARENAVRNPRRTAATAAALMIGVALVGLITVFAASTKASISAQVDRAFKANFIITPKGGFGPGGGGSGLSPVIARQVGDLSQVKAASGGRFVVVTIDGKKNKFAIGMDTAVADDLFDLKVSEGSVAAVKDSDIAVSGRIARENGWKIGTPLEVDFGSAPSRPLTIAAIFENGQREGLADYAVTLGELDAANLPSQLDQQVYVALNPGVSIEDGKQALETVVKAYPNAEVLDQSAFKERISAQINQLLALIYVLLALAIIIAVIGIMNTLALSIFERTREIGLLRAVGMSRRQLRAMVRWESVIIAVFGALLGLVIGVTFGAAIISALKDQGIEKFAAPPLQLLAIVLLAALAGILAAILPARRAAKLDVLRAISSE
jgi:putative ABC transport system permease protein